MNKISFFILFFFSSVTAFSQTATLGSGTTHTNGFASDPVDGYYNSMRYQVVYTAAELTTAGVPSGASISSLGFSVSEGYGAGSLANYTVKLGHTTASNSAAHDASTTTTVKNAFSYSPTVVPAGSFDMIPFDANFIWNGTDNLLVDICTGVFNPFISPNGGVRTYAASTANGSRVKRDDGGTDQCGLTTTTTNSTKPQIQFSYTTGACSGVPNPGATNSSVSSTCPGFPFTLNLQNSTVGAGVTYVWQSADDAAFTANVQTLSSNSETQNIISQTVNSYYRCIVTCSGNSTNSVPVLVTMSPVTSCYCVPAYSDGTQFGDLISNISIVGTSLSNSTGTSASGPSYTYYTGAPNLTTTLQAGSSYSVSITVGTSSDQNLAAWIDYNDDGVFGSSEKIGFTTSSIASNGSAAFNIVLDCNPPLGTHRMRVRDVFSTAGNSIDPCALYGFGETEDYDITITAAVACPAPTALVTTSATTTSIELDWSIGCAETSWEVIYGPIGFNPSSSGTTVSATTIPFNVTGLTCATNYDFYVKADCGVSGGMSLNSNVTTLSTAPCSCSGSPSPGNTISSVGITCPDSPFDLTLQFPTTLAGLTYLWESADDPAFTVNVVTLGSTADTQSIVTQTGASYYRCLVTCTNSSLITYSTPVFVDQTAQTNCYCTPVTTQGCSNGDVIAQVTLNTLNNNSGANCPSGTLGYSDYTSNSSLTTSLIAGNTYSWQVWAGENSENYALWIDYNDDGVFDNASEKVGFTTSLVAGSGIPGTIGFNANIPITLDCNASVGSHRLRVRAMPNVSGNLITPCGSNMNGETEDYLITIASPVACPTPSSLVASNPTTTSVDLNWTIGCSETSWNVIYGPTGFDPMTGGTTLIAGTNPYTVTGLTCETGYDFYVQADCGVVDGTSSLSLVASSLTILCSCSGTPTPGNTIANNSVCSSGGTVNLSLQNSTSGSAVTYQWESADDAAFTTNVLSLGTLDNETAAVTGPTYYRCIVTCATGPASGTSTPVLVDITSVPTVGNTFAAPIIIGEAPCDAVAYNNVLNNGDCYTDAYVGTNNQASPDLFYQFTLSTNETVKVSLCGSGFDTRLHILDNTGTEIFDNDDNGPSCSGSESSIEQALLAGTYYVVAEGFGANTGTLNLTLGKVCTADVNITAFIEGYFIPGTGLMQPVIANSVFGPPTLECDTLTVELHDATSTLSAPVIAETYTGVLATDGTMTATFPGTINGNSYYIVLKHRNALQTWSTNPVLIGASTSYDFSVLANVFGGNAKLVNPGVYAIFSGNLNGDGFVDVSDYPVWETASNAFAFGYVDSDLNGDGLVDLSDYTIWEANSNAFVFVFAPF